MRNSFLAFLVVLAPLTAKAGDVCSIAACTTEQPANGICVVGEDCDDTVTVGTGQTQIMFNGASVSDCKDGYATTMAQLNKMVAQGSCVKEATQCGVVKNDDDQIVLTINDVYVVGYDNAAGGTTAFNKANADRKVLQQAGLCNK